MSKQFIKIDSSKLVFRDMLSEDLSNVVAIERNAHVSPWSRLSFEESITKQEFFINLTPQTNRYLCRVLALESEILGYFVISPVADEMHILNIVTAPQYQGQGLGHVALKEIIRLTQEQQKLKIFLEVRASNFKAQNLYLKWQFKQISIRKAYYSLPTISTNKREDAFIFMRSLEKDS